VGIAVKVEIYYGQILYFVEASLSSAEAPYERFLNNVGFGRAGIP